MKEKRKVTSYPENSVWYRTRNGKWVSRPVTPYVKKARSEFCEAREWECVKGCK